MTDAEYIFKSVSMERKRNGIGTYNKKRQGGKQVRFPSDNLSRGEKRKLNGEVKTYSFRNPISWEDFRRMPKDIKQEYLDTINKNFEGIPNALIAEMLGVDQHYFSRCLGRYGVVCGDGKRNQTKNFLESEAGSAWRRWTNRENVLADADNGEGSDEIGSEVVDDAGVVIEQRMEQDSGMESFISALNMLRGSGTKITIEITL